MINLVNYNLFELINFEIYNCYNWIYEINIIVLLNMVKENV